MIMCFLWLLFILTLPRNVKLKEVHEILRMQSYKIPQKDSYFFLCFKILSIDRERVWVRVDRFLLTLQEGVRSEIEPYKTPSHKKYWNYSLPQFLIHYSNPSSLLKGKGRDGIHFPYIISTPSIGKTARLERSLKSVFNQFGT